MGRRRRRFQAFTADLQIEDASSDGRGIARHEGQVVFVKYAVPGDQAKVYVFTKEKGALSGLVDEILVPSELRVNPNCQHFGDCGGCKWQNMQYEAQAAMKQKQVEETIRRIGKVEAQEYRTILSCENPYYYRNKLEFSFSNKAWLKKGDMDLAKVDQRVLGYHMARVFDKVLPIESCWLQKPIVNDIRNAVLEFARSHDYSFYDYRNHEGFLRNLAFRSSEHSGELMLILVVNDDDWSRVAPIFTFLEEKFPQITSFVWMVNMKLNNVFNDLPYRVWKGPAYITERLGKYDFRISPISFFQTNPKQARLLYDVVKDYLSDILPEGKIKHDCVYDLYSGTGSIGIYISELAEKVVGVEYVEAAIKDARENVRINELDHFSFHAGDMKQILTDSFTAIEGHPDVIIADPPRQGMDPKVIRQILKLGVEYIIYVSCKASTQARDIQLLSEDYELLRIQPVDMFPHTAHVENVALLKRKATPESV